MTDLSRWIEWVNNLGGIGQDKKKILKDLARNLANSNGEFGPADRDKLQKKYEEVTGKPWRDSGYSWGVSKPPANNQPPGDNRDKNPPGGNDDGLWGKFRSNWVELGTNDKKIVKNVFPKVNADSFKNLSLNKRNALVDAVDDNNITKDEKEKLYKVFNYKDSGDSPPGGKPPGGKPPGGKPPGDGDESGWDKFLKIWRSNKFRDNKSDRDFIKDKIFKGRDINRENWKKIDPDTRKKLLDYLGDYDLSSEERKSLLGKGRDPEPEPEPPGDDGPGDDDDDDDDGDDDDDDGDDDDSSSVDEVDDSDVKTGQKTRKKIKSDKDLATRTTIFVPENSDRIFMPNIDNKIKKEVERLTLKLTNFTKEFIEAGQDFSSIDFVPLQEIFDDNDILYFIGKDPNVPDNYVPGQGEAVRVLAEIVALIQLELNKGNENTNYASFLDLFQLKYNDGGSPYYRFNLELQNDILGEIRISVVKDDPDDEPDPEAADVDLRLALDEEETTLEE